MSAFSCDRRVLAAAIRKPLLLAALIERCDTTFGCRLFGTTKPLVLSASTISRLSRHRLLLGASSQNLIKEPVRHASRLTSKQINHILRMREMHAEDSLQPPLQSLWSSQLAANYPIEDRRVFAHLPHCNGYLVGVIDGHGGGACAQAVKEWLPAYVAASLMPLDQLEMYAESLARNTKQQSKSPDWPNGKGGLENEAKQPFRAVKVFVDPTDYVRGELFSFYQQSLARYVNNELERRRKYNLINVDSNQQIAEALVRAFCAFDDDISENGQALEHVARAYEQQHATTQDASDKPDRYADVVDGKPHDETVARMFTYSKPDLEKLSIALSGAVCIFAFIRERDVFVASTGDCSAALATVEGDQLRVTRMNAIHVVENAAEMERLKSEHPPGEASTLIKADRLLGQLLPLRSFGDAQYKWPLELQRTLFRRLQLMHYTPPNYATPPYLTAQPEVRHFQLNDPNSSQVGQQFIMMTSDGLIEWMNEEQACRIVYEHTRGKQAIEPFDSSSVGDVTLSELNSILKGRKSGLQQKPEDENVATHLIRTALGATPEKQRVQGSGVSFVDPMRLSRALSVPLNQARYTRDDFTVTVIFLGAASAPTTATKAA